MDTCRLASAVTHGLDGIATCRVSSADTVVDMDTCRLASADTDVDQLVVDEADDLRMCLLTKI
jgi:hypothetical protein